jgi:hypothetical protein
MSEQVCNRCFESKHISHFYFDVKNNSQWRICKQCKQKNPAKIKEMKKRKSLTSEDRLKYNIKECLRCENDFMSTGKFNRLCANCGQSDDNNY